MMTWIQLLNSKTAASGKEMNMDGWNHLYRCGMKAKEAYFTSGNTCAAVFVRRSLCICLPTGRSTDVNYQAALIYLLMYHLFMFVISVCHSRASLSICIYLLEKVTAWEAAAQTHPQRENNTAKC